MSHSISILADGLVQGGVLVPTSRPCFEDLPGYQHAAHRIDDNMAELSSTARSLLSECLGIADRAPNDSAQPVVSRLEGSAVVQFERHWET